MADVFARRNAAKSADTTVISSAADFEGLPTLSALMAGVGKPDGKGWTSPPHTLTLWLEGAVCKFAIGAGDEEPKCFGTIPDLSHGLPGVEKSLVADHCEWKKPKGPKLGYAR